MNRISLQFLRYLLVIIFIDLAGIFCAVAQTFPSKHFYNKAGQETDSLNAEYFTVDSFLFNNPELKWGTIKTYGMNGIIKTQVEYSDIANRIVDGKIKIFYPEGNLKLEVNYKNKQLDGMQSEYYPDNKLKRRDTYSNGKFIFGNCFTPLGKDTAHFQAGKELAYHYINALLGKQSNDNNITEVVDARKVTVLPKYKGGDTEMMKFLAQNIQYPLEAKEKGITGTVYVSFIVGIDGTTSGHKVMIHVDPLLEEEALRVARKIKFESPGMQDQEPVSVQLTLPIRFVLQSGK